MKKQIIALIIGFLKISFVYAQPTLFENINKKYEEGTLPELKIYSKQEGRITAGRCVESTWPNKVLGAYFVGQSVENDPFVQFMGIAEYSNYGIEYFDQGHKVKDGSISRERVPLVLQNDGKTYQAETDSRTLLSLRAYAGILLVKMQIFQQDTEVICYYNKIYPD